MMVVVDTNRDENTLWGLGTWSYNNNGKKKGKTTDDIHKVQLFQISTVFAIATVKVSKGSI